MPALYRVDVVSNRHHAELPGHKLAATALLRLAQKGKMKDRAALERDPDKYFAELVARLRALDPAAAAKAMPANAKLLPAALDLKRLALHLAHPTAHPPATGASVTLRVRATHPDAGFPDHRDPGRNLETFVLRLIADGSAKNAVRATYGAKLDARNLRVRSQDLWDFAMARPAKSETTVDIVTDAQLVAHLAPGGAYDSTAFAG